MKDVGYGRKMLSYTIYARDVWGSNSCSFSLLCEQYIMGPISMLQVKVVFNLLTWSKQGGAYRYESTPYQCLASSGSNTQSQYKYTDKKMLCIEQN